MQRSELVRGLSWITHLICQGLFLELSLKPVEETSLNQLRMVEAREDPTPYSQAQGAPLSLGIITARTGPQGPSGSHLSAGPPRIPFSSNAWLKHPGWAQSLGEPSCHVHSGQQPARILKSPGWEALAPECGLIKGLPSYQGERWLCLPRMLWYQHLPIPVRQGGTDCLAKPSPEATRARASVSWGPRSPVCPALYLNLQLLNTNPKWELFGVRALNPGCGALPVLGCIAAVLAHLRRQPGWVRGFCF